MSTGNTVKAHVDIGCELDQVTLTMPYRHAAALKSALNRVVPETDGRDGLWQLMEIRRALEAVYIRNFEDVPRPETEKPESE